MDMTPPLSSGFSLTGSEGKTNAEARKVADAEKCAVVPAVSVSRHSANRCGLGQFQVPRRHSPT
jgi:hypothetical protein